MTTKKTVLIRRRNAEIWSLHEKGKSYREIGSTFNLSPDSVYKIIKEFKKMLSEAPTPHDHSTRDRAPVNTQEKAFFNPTQTKEYRTLLLRYNSLKVLTMNLLMEDTAEYASNALSELEMFTSTHNLNVQ